MCRLKSDRQEDMKTGPPTPHAGSGRSQNSGWQCCVQLCVSFEHQVLLAYVKAFETAQDEPRRPRKLTKTHTFLKTAETRKITIMTLFENLINAVDPCCRKINLSIHMVAHIAFQVVQRPLEPIQKHECPTQKEQVL